MPERESFSTMPDDSFPVKPIYEKRAFEQISDQIRDLIYARKLKPGDRLPPERELAEKFRVGRTAVREGLRILEQSGLISVRQGCGGGSFVKEVDGSVVSKSLCDVIKRSDVTVDHLIEVRIAVEKLVIGSAMARITQSELDILRKCIEDAEAILETSARESRLPELDLWVKINSEFHLVLARATRNPLFEMVVESLMSVLRTFLNDPPLVPEFFQGHTKYHRAIYDAVRDKNLRLAERRLEKHILWIGKTLNVDKIPVEAGGTQCSNVVSTKKDKEGKHGKAKG
jgi:DNA-binding FadR family transcriptional regulator